MSFDHLKIIFLIFCVTLNTILISFISFNRSESIHNKKINHTTSMTSNGSILTLTTANPLSFETTYNHFTNDGRDFTQEYKYITDQDQSKLKTENIDSVNGCISENIDEYHTGSNDAISASIQNFDQNPINFYENFIKTVKISQDLFNLKIDRASLKTIVDLFVVNHYTSIQQISKPLLCILKEISNITKLKINTEDEVRYFFEYKLIELNHQITQDISKLRNASIKQNSAALDICKDNLIATLYWFFSFIYDFSAMPFAYISSSHFGDFHDIKIDKLNDQLKFINITSSATEDKQISLSLSNIYEYSSNEETGKNITFFDFPVEKTFSADLFKGLIEKPEESYQKLVLLKEKIIKNISDDIKNNWRTYNLNPNNEVVILLPSFKNFLKYACLDNFKDLYGFTNGIYFYKYEDFNNNDNSNDKGKIRNDNESYKGQFLTIPHESKSYLLYREFLTFYDDIIDTVRELLKNEVNHHLTNQKEMTKKDS